MLPRGFRSESHLLLWVTTSSYLVGVQYSLDLLMIEYSNMTWLGCLAVSVSFLENSRYWLFSVSKRMFSYMQDFKQAALSCYWSQEKHIAAWYNLAWAVQRYLNLAKLVLKGMTRQKPLCKWDLYICEIKGIMRREEWKGGNWSKT